MTALPSPASAETSCERPRPGRLSLYGTAMVLFVACAGTVQAQPQGAASAAGPKASNARVDASRSGWNSLPPAQRQALAPLAATWATISESQKRKWLALGQSYPRLPAAEQARLHARMTEWAALSPQQRAQARLNFAEASQVPADERKAKWEAYQALSTEEKRKLAAGAVKPPTAAAAVRPAASQRLATVPASGTEVKVPRIAGSADQINLNTLLPQPGAQAAASGTQ